MTMHSSEPHLQSPLTTAAASTTASARAGLINGLEGPANALIVGASGGIGHALAERLATDPGIGRLFLASRTAPESARLRTLRERHGQRLELIRCDVTDETSLTKLHSRLARETHRLHLVVNAAGLLHDPDMAPEKTLRQVLLKNLQRSFAVNAFGPILLARELLPLLTHSEPAVFASLSARVGSIADNRLGGWYAYRAAKAAHNQLMRTFAIELSRLNRHAVVLALHPGTVDTGLSSPFSANVAADKLLKPEYAAERLLEVIAARSAAESGSFHAWDGKPIPW